MKTTNILLLLALLILTFNSNSYSQSGNVTDFLPLQVGNVWVYQHSSFGQPPCYCSKKIRIKLIGTNVYNGKTYFQSQISTIVNSCAVGCERGFLPFDSLLRVDSSNGKVLKYMPGAGCITPNETLLDSLKARLNDTIWVYCEHPVWYSTYICSDTNNITIFGSSRPVRRYKILGFESGWSRTYAKGIGLTVSSCYTVFCNGNTQLLGCVINGVVYGDTNFLVGINKISSEVPSEFSLSQNYPNPFNPSTKIRFAIPPPAKAGQVMEGGRGRIISLIIYDILGREIQTLVNEQLSPGTYEVDFDGTKYSSGVYYYRFTVSTEHLTESFVETRRMVLIK